MASAQYSRWLKATLSEAGWAPSLVFIVHEDVHVAFKAYDRYPPLDRPFHFLGGVVIAFFLSRASFNASRFGVIGPFQLTAHVALVASLVCSATVFWEFAEYVYDRLFGTRHQLSLNDTLLDMLLGIIGGWVFLVMSAWAGGLTVPSHAQEDVSVARPPL
jgi:hypothetical protein